MPVRGMGYRPRPSWTRQERSHELDQYKDDAFWRQRRAAPRAKLIHNGLRVVNSAIAPNQNLTEGPAVKGLGWAVKPNRSIRRLASRRP